MALRNVLKEGDPVLRKKAREVTKFDDRLKELASDMLETMRHDNGVGLAAPQIGILKRMFVMNVEDESGDHVVINPRIISSEGLQHELEGCLSLPGLYGIVERPERVTVEYEDVNGQTLQMQAEGLKAICICHESDHLDGVLFRDRAKGGLYRVNEKGEAVPEKGGSAVSLELLTGEGGHENEL